MYGGLAGIDAVEGVWVGFFGEGFEVGDKVGFEVGDKVGFEVGDKVGFEVRDIIDFKFGLLVSKCHISGGLILW